MLNSRLTRRPKTEYALLAASLGTSAASTWSLYQLMGPASCWPTAAILWGLYRLWRFWAWHDGWRGLHQPVVKPLGAKQISQGKPERIALGEGFVWGSAQAQLIHDYQRDIGELPYAEAAAGSYAYQGIGQDQVKPIDIPTSILRKHMLIEGQTGSGKSQLATVICRSLIAKSCGAVVVIEPKDDPDLVGHLICAAHQAGRKLAIFAPYFPTLSCGLNPLSTCRSPSEVRARLSALMPQSREQYFSGRSLLSLERTAAMQRAIGEAWDLRSLLCDATVHARRRYLTAKYLHAIGVPIDARDAFNPPGSQEIATAYAEAGLQDDLAEVVIEDLSTDLQHYKQVIDNLNVGLGDVVNTGWRRLLTDPQALTWTEIDQDQMVLIVLTASLLTRELGCKTSTLIVQDFIGHMGRRITTESDAERRPIYLVTDELAQMAYPGITAALAMVGGAGGRIVAMWQSRAGLADAIGDHAAQELVDNIQTRVYLAMADDEAAVHIADSMGTRQLLTTSDARRRDDESGFSGSRTVNQTLKRLVEPQWLTALPPGHGWARIGGRHYKMVAPLLESFDPGVVEQLGYGDLVETIRRNKERKRREKFNFDTDNGAHDRACVGRYQ